MKIRFVTSIMAVVALVMPVAAQQMPEVRYVEASTLTLVGKMMPTPNPYWRVDTEAYSGFTSTETNQVRCGVGMAIAFRTDSPYIYLGISRRPSYNGKSTGILSSAGFDLYIKSGDKWIWAANTGFVNGDDGPRRLIDGMDGSMHECLMYLPIHTELYSLQIGTMPGSVTEPLDNPFRHRIVFCGSSYTHGGSTSRPAMSYPAQFERMTGWEVLSLGCGGNGRLQPHFADVLCDVQADAFIFDQFSNPSAEVICERLIPFVSKVRAAHPGVPIIFQQTIRRERRNFNTAMQSRDSVKMAVADSLMRQVCKQFDDIYYITPRIDDPTHEFTVDGTHLDNYGYYLWARSIERPVRRILRKYGIK